jgi:hypothetical protein
MQYVTTMGPVTGEIGSLWSVLIPLFGGIVLGWTARNIIPDAPYGTDPDFWAVSVRRRRRKRKIRRRNDIE